MSQEYKEYRIEPTKPGKAAIEFKGIERGFASSEREGVDRWTEMTLYETESGKWIVKRVGCSDRDGEEDREDYLIFRDQNRMTSRLDFNSLVQDLYAQAGIESARVI